MLGSLRLRFLLWDGIGLGNKPIAASDRRFGGPPTNTRDTFS